MMFSVVHTWMTTCGRNSTWMLDATPKEHAVETMFTTKEHSV